MENEIKGASVDKLNKYFKTGNQDNNRFEYKDKSFLTKMGFQDNDMKTPEHDKMIDILMDDKVLTKITNMTIGHELNKFIHKWKKEEEYVVKGHNDYIIGYIDLLASNSAKFLHTCKKHDSDETFEWYSNESVKLSIEVKIKIESIGELIRQVNTYRTIIKDAYFIVVSSNITENQQKRLLESNIKLIDIRELI